MTESELVNSAVNAALKGKSDRANPIRAVATAKRGPYSFVSLVFPVHLDPPTAPILPLASFLLHKLPPPPHCPLLALLPRANGPDSLTTRTALLAPKATGKATRTSQTCRHYWHLWSCQGERVEVAERWKISD